MSQTNLQHMDMDTSCETKKRKPPETWARHAEFFFCTLGGCVGFGNLWRFPYLCMRNGGGAFLIPYAFFLVMCAIPMAYMESIMGQYSGFGYMGQWNICPLFKGAGHLCTFLNLAWLAYYAIIVAWSLYFVGASFATQVPWATCENWWNTPACADLTNATIRNQSTTTQLSLNNTLANVSYLGHHWNTSVENGTTLAIKHTTPAEEFFEHNVLQMTKSIEDIGGIRWELLASLAAAWVLTILCLIKGVRTSGKVSYFTGGAPYILLLILLIRGCTLPGAGEGLKFYLTPDFRRLADIKVWGEACVQVFMSLSVCNGFFITLTGYNKFNNNCCRDAIVIPILSGSTSFMAGFVVFSALGFMAHKLDVEVVEVAKAGPSLAFVAYPEALRQLPIAPMWSILFFLTVILVGLDSGFTLVDAILKGLSDEFKAVKDHKTISVIAIGIFLFILGIPMVTKGGIYILTFIDWYGFNFCQLLVGFCECIAVGWRYGPARIGGNVRAMIGRNPGSKWWTLCWRFFTPATIAFMLVFNAITFRPALYGSYKFPYSVACFGLFFSVGQLFIIPGFMGYLIWRTPGPFLQRLRFLLKPSPDWGKREDGCPATIINSSEMLSHSH